MIPRWHRNISYLDFKGLVHQLQQETAGNLESAVEHLASFRSTAQDPDIRALPPELYMEKILKITIVEEAFRQYIHLQKDPEKAKANPNIDFEVILEHLTHPKMYELSTKSYELATILAPLALTSQSVIALRQRESLTLEQATTSVLVQTCLNWMNRVGEFRLDTCFYKDVIYQTTFGTGHAWEDLKDTKAYINTVSEYCLPLAHRLGMPIGDLRFNMLLHMGYQSQGAEQFQQLCLAWDRLLQEPALDPLRIEDMGIQSDYTC